MNSRLITLRQLVREIIHEQSEKEVDIAKYLPPGHDLGMRVPKGGSSCSKCKWGNAGDGKPWCSNEMFQAWRAEAQDVRENAEVLPAPADEYCCDLYQSS